MKKDDLLIKYFNNELNESELEQFNNLLNGDAAFRDEFQRLSKLENNLNGLATQLTVDDYAFIKQTGDNLVNAGHGSVSHSASAPAKSSFMSMKVFLTSAIVISLLAILAYFSYKSFIDKPNDTVKQTALRNTSEKTSEPEAQVNQTNQTEYEITDSPEEILITQKETERKSIEQPVATIREKTTTKNRSELQGKIKDINPVKNQEIIAQLHNELNEYRKNGDLLNEVWTLKRLGIFYRQLGEYAESETYLSKALNAATALNNPSLTAEIYGEMACLYYESNKQDKGNSFKSKCLGLLETNSAKRAKYWQKKFKKYQ